MSTHAQKLSLPVHDFTVYAFADDTPYTVRADCDLAALEQAPVPCYIVVEYPNQKPDAASAVAALKKHRADIEDWQGKRKEAANGY